MAITRDANVITTNTTTETASLAAGAKVISASTSTGIASGVIGNDVDLYMWADMVFSMTWSGAPTLNSTVDVYFIPAVDGTTFADGSSTVIPSQALFKGSFVFQASATLQVIAITGITLPPEKFKVLLINNTGSAFPVGGATVKMQRYKI